MKIMTTIAAAALLAACHESFDERLAREAHDLSRRNCPRRIDAFTILDSITYTPDARLWSYCYSLSDSLDDEAVLTEELRSNFHESLQQSVTNDISLRRFKDKGITIVYSYRSASTGKELLREVFTADDY